MDIITNSGGMEETVIKITTTEEKSTHGELFEKKTQDTWWSLMEMLSPVPL